MERKSDKQKPDEFSISVTRFEVNLISNIIYIALNHLELDEYSHKKAQEFIVKMQKTVLGSQRQSAHSH